ncbi:MAG TPA: SDR family oxidoreductase [Terriglobia bacterium]|nr:SDR family oxidoreductase [Terriglobia bacterium]
MEKILITGISGFLGWNLVQRLKDQYHVYGTSLDNPVSIPGVETFTFDLSDWSKIERLCQAVDPAVIVHTAAYSNPDYCELHHKVALTLNTFASRELAKAANRLGSKLIYTSSDFVFDGRRGEYSEADDPAPINYYGKTKFLAELEIMNHCSHYVTLRIGTLYGRGNGIRPNFFETMEKQLLAGKKPPCIIDQYRTFLFVEDAVQAISQLIAEKTLKGLFHLGGPEKASRVQFAETLCATLGVSDSLIEKVRLADFSSAAARPPDCSLNSNKIKKTLDLNPRSISQAFDQLCARG